MQDVLKILIITVGHSVSGPIQDNSKKKKKKKKKKKRKKKKERKKGIFFHFYFPDSFKLSTANFVIHN